MTDNKLPAGLVKDLESKGYVLVPKEPTKEMEYAGLFAAEQGVVRAADYEYSAAVCDDTALQVWRAMIERWLQLS